MQSEPAVRECCPCSFPLVRIEFCLTQHTVCCSDGLTRFAPAATPPRRLEGWGKGIMDYGTAQRDRGRSAVGDRGAPRASNP